MNDRQLMQSALELYQSGNLEEAENICREIVKTEPENSEALHLFGLIFYQQGNYDLAIKKIRKALKLDPENAEAYYDLANVMQDKGESTKALTNYRKAVKLNPEFAEAYNNIGIALHDNLQLEKAIKSYREAIRINPAYAEAYNNLGVAFQEQKRLDEAITHFQKALLLKPEYANAYHNLVEAVQGTGYEKQEKSGGNTVYAVYRCLLGEDFIQESVSSISDLVDKIFIFWDDTPYGNVTGHVYKGEPVQFPKKFDTILEKIAELNNPKIELIYNHQESAENQLTHFVNDAILPGFEKPSVIMFLQADHVFRSDQAGKALDEFIQKGYIFATTHMVEVWKGLRHRLPERQNKTGVVFCNLSKLEKMPATLKHGGVLVMPKLSAFVHDFNFAVSEKTMSWKHLLSLAYAQTSGENSPFENWYEEKWLNWDYESNNQNLDISEKELVLGAIPYDSNELPELIRKKYSF